MKIYIITTETFPNGMAATQRIKCYAKSIVDLGYQCEVLCLNRCENLSAPLGNVKTSGEMDGYSYRYLGRSTFKKKGWRNKANQVLDTVRLFFLILNSFHPGDKVIFYSYNSALREFVIALSRFLRYEVFFEMNEHPSIQMSGFKMEDDNPKDLKRLYKALRGIDGILCISASLKRLLTMSGIDDKKLHIVNMLVDASRFEGVFRQDNEPYIGYCGSADNKKDGVDQLIKAFGKIAGKYPELKLYIMGPITKESGNEELARELGLAERIVFSGMISPVEMPQMIKNAKVLALARPMSLQAMYGFPTKLGEYLLSSNPVIVTSVGDIPRFLQDLKSAYLVEPDDIDSFADKLDYALSHPEESMRIGEKGRQVAIEHFSGSRIMTQLKIALELW